MQQLCGCDLYGAVNFDTEILISVKKFSANSSEKNNNKQ